MKLQKFFPIFVIFMLMCGLASCDTTRRASRRIQSILNEHPELLDRDTIRVDTIITAALPSDSVIFTFEDFYIADSDSCTVNPTDIITHKTEQGTFVIERLLSRGGFKVTYQPDTLQIRARASYVVPRITVQQERKTDIGEIVKWLVIGIIVILFARLLLKK